MAFLGSAILVFVFRLAGKPRVEKWLGYFEFFLAIPLVWLLLRGIVEKQQPLYFIQVRVVFLWLVLEFFLDYWLKIDFRRTQWMVILYVTLFFAAAGGMVGIASQCGKIWGIIAIILFFAAAVLAFIQRKITGK